jgi:xanthine/uracil permease
MVDEAELTKTISLEMAQTAMQRASHRAKAARWDLDVAVFFFSILAIVIILLFQGIKTEVVMPVAILGLAMGWLMGLKKGKQVYELFYEEELSKLDEELEKTMGTLEEMIAEKVQRVRHERLG